MRSDQSRVFIGPRGKAAIVAGAALLLASVTASDAQTRYDWTGFYIGAHFGYGTGTFGPGTNPIIGEAWPLTPGVTGYAAGYQAGYNVELVNRIVLGIETDATFASPPQPDQPINRLAQRFDYIATVRPRVGFAFGRWLPFATGGFAWGQTQLDLNDPTGLVIGSWKAVHPGWVAGGGFEYALTGHWVATLEYDYIDLARRTYVASTPTDTTVVGVEPKIHLIKAGLNYRLGAMPGSASAAGVLPESDDWSIHSQTTAIVQGYPNIHSPYQGPFSLPARGQTRETWTATLFIGRKLWEGGEVYFNPELAQGFGLNGTFGLAGFSNGEAQKAGGEFPRIRPQRYFFRQTFGFGGEQETVEDGANQFAGKRDVDRLTLTVGKIAVGDIFDDNSYAHDPRANFMNWALWSSAAYDFPADLPGYTRGAVAELNQKNWALRAGVFQVPEAPASDKLVLKGGGGIVEFEERHSIADQPGKLRLGVFSNRGNTASYSDAVALAAADPTTDINTITANIRRLRQKTGVYGNLEQALAGDLGMFARASWNDGKNEILSFTDIDRSASGGLSLKGRAWGRADDTVGLGGAINGLSQAHRNFLAAGGLGLLIGDGQLNYREEKIIETYYAYSVNKSATLSFDYQFITNPAFNADRGPASIFGARFHAEF